MIESIHRLQLLCTTLFLLKVTKLLGRAVANSCQWGMVLCAANPDVVISPPVVLALGTIAFFVGAVDIMIEFWTPDSHHKVCFKCDAKIEVVCDDRLAIIILICRRITCMIDCYLGVQFGGGIF